MKYILIALLLLPCVVGLSWQDTAQSLEGENITQSASNIEVYLYWTITYTYYTHARGTEYTWASKKGDCTDTAMLMQSMLKELGIKSRLVHGYTIESKKNRIKQSKHDWLEYWSGSDWVGVEPGNYRVGEGIW